MGTRGAFVHRLIISAVLGLALAAAITTTASASAQAADPGTKCFWDPVFSQDTDDPEKNFAYPDIQVSYWSSRFTLPPGARLILDGYYSKSRYQSVNAYIDGAPSDTIKDTEIKPSGRSINPFRPGNRRDLPLRKRMWKLKVLDSPVPEGRRKANTIYASAEGGVQEVLYRVYLPDRGTGAAGSVPLPSPTVILADGTRLTGAAGCGPVNDPVRSLTPLRLPLPLYETLLNTPGADFATAPAMTTPHWENFFNFGHALSAYKLGTPAEAERLDVPATQDGGQYSNGDARYISAAISRHYGQILVLKAKMPTFPHTWRGAKRARAGQVRYWSLCQNKTPDTTSVVSCLYDEQIPLTRKRNFTVVVGRSADRPRTATRKCGVAWLNWGNHVDPFGRTGTGMLIMRNVVASPRFRQAIQRIDEFGEESSVMGPYLPKSRYMDKADFDAPRC